MSIQYGAPEEWLRPLQQQIDKIGTHRGPHEALNVKNPKPDMHYYCCARTASAVQRFINEGWEVVPKDSQERWGAELPASVQAEIDSTRAYQDVMLIRTSSENYRRIQTDKHRDAQAALQAVDDGFLAAGERIDNQLGRHGTDKPTYYKKSNHLAWGEPYRG